jgi:hypothetical protein
LYSPRTKNTECCDIIPIEPFSAKRCPQDDRRKEKFHRCQRSWSSDRGPELGTGYALSMITFSMPEVRNMRSLHLTNLPLPVYKNELLQTSKRKNSSLYEIIFPHHQGLGAHIHTSGEDCALVLSGNLTYFVGNRETIEASQVVSCSAGKMSCTGT